MDRQQEANYASQSSSTPSSTTPINDNSRSSGPLPNPMPPPITISPEMKQEVTDRILQNATAIIISGGAAAAYDKIHSPEFARILADVILYTVARCYSGRLFRKLDELLEKMRSLARHYATAAEDFAKRSREFAEAASGQGKFRIVGKGGKAAGGRGGDWDGSAAEAEADVLAGAAARDKARADSLRRKVKELLDAVADNLSWYRESRSVIHVGIVDKALHQYADVLEELGLATTTITAATTPPGSSREGGGEPSGLSSEERYATSSESESSQYSSSSGSDTVRG